MFLLKNNDTRSYGFAGQLCVAGSGNPTPPEAAKHVVNGQSFRLPPMFELGPEEMFKSFRGVLAAMRVPTRQGKPAIEVFVEGVPSALTEKDILDWVAEYRSHKGFPAPKSALDHTREVERAMARPEDPLEVQRRADRMQDQSQLVSLVTAAVLAALQSQGKTPAPEPAAQPSAQGRNDEKPEDPSPPQGRARPR